MWHVVLGLALAFTLLPALSTHAQDYEYVNDVLVKGVNDGDEWTSMKTSMNTVRD